MIVLDGASLTPAAVAAIARDGEPVELTAQARARNVSAREAIAARLARGEPLYGATTGVGALRDRAVDDSERGQFNWNLLRSHAVSAGPPVDRVLEGNIADPHLLSNVYGLNAAFFRKFSAQRVPVRFTGIDAASRCDPERFTSAAVRICAKQEHAVLSVHENRADCCPF